jgi:hypothetical protein
VIEAEAQMVEVHLRIYLLDELTLPGKALSQGNLGSQFYGVIIDQIYYSIWRNSVEWVMPLD